MDVVSPRLQATWGAGYFVTLTAAVGYHTYFFTLLALLHGLEALKIRSAFRKGGWLTLLQPLQRHTPPERQLQEKGRPARIGRQRNACSNHWGTQ